MKNKLQQKKMEKKFLNPKKKFKKFFVQKKNSKKTSQNHKNRSISKSMRVGKKSLIRKLWQIEFSTTFCADVLARIFNNAQKT